MRTHSSVGAYPFASYPLQGGKLQVRVWGIRGDATLADVHAPILTLICDARKSLFVQS
jgi:hypothetical protein